MSIAIPRWFRLTISVLLEIAFVSAASAELPIDFNRDVRPILSNKCFACHGPDEQQRQAGLRLDDAKNATSALESGATAIVAGDLVASELIRRVTHSDESQRMPPAEFGKPLTPEEIVILRRWIEQGAHFQAHWSYVKPARPVPPAAPAAWEHWPRNPIDHFALQAMLAHGFSPSPEADRYALARRAFLDLTGLPPTIEEVDAFVDSDGPQAYEHLVDDLLQRPSYGEHWARQWLDLARYADSAGYADDPPREIWAYRDWVIKAINKNMPFDQFTIEQLAGDLLPNPSEEQLVATAFHRNTMTNNEGGTQDEEFRNAAIVDRVNTTMAVWMGTTIACAQCHDHKYDPITQQEYFRFFAILNNTQDEDRRDEAPVLTFFSDEQRRQQDELKAHIARLQAVIETPTDELAHEQRLWENELGEEQVQDAIPAVSIDHDAPQPGNTRAASRGVLKRSRLSAAVAAVLDKAVEERTSQEAAELAKYFRAKAAPSLRAQRKELAVVTAKLRDMKPMTTLPVVRERSGERRETRFQHRGNYLDQGPEVEPGLPATFHPASADGPLDRQSLARWLVDENNPLTARVIANRYWEALFGRGIVVTSEEFGSQGELPTHPELLDWLATELMDNGWDTRALVRSIVTSAVYRQSSQNVGGAAEIDPDNRWLARGPRVRLSAETVRDQALAVSGLFSREMYGPPVRPPQPNLGLTAAFGGSTDWETSTGDDRYRRGIYTTWRRSNPYPSMATFDAPNREVCTMRRGRTNTPLQCLVTLNDPVYVEAAQALARRAIQHTTTTEDRIAYAFRCCLLRPPRAAELRALTDLYEESRARMAERPDEAKKLATVPIGELPNEIDVFDAAAMTIVGNVLLNLDEMILKR